MAPRLCPNEACGCEPGPDHDYCGPSCERADRDDDATTTCECGHPECRPENAELYDPNGEGPLRPEDVENQ